MSDPNAPFAGNAAIVFGGGRNMGRAVVLEFARRGADVAIADLDEQGAQETADLVKALGRQACAVRCDVASEDSVRHAADEAERQLGPMHIVMNNAGILSGGNPEDIPLDAWRQVMDVNFFGMVRSNAVFVPRLIARGRGHIVNTASFAGLYPYATSRMHYAASKAAVLSMTENLALYLTPTGVRVSCFCPGPVMTPVTAGMTQYSADVIMRMPGSHFVLKSQEEAAQSLADGMRDGRILIPTDEQLWATLQSRAAAPDDFIRSKAAAFAAGDSGRPQTPAHLRATP